MTDEPSYYALRVCPEADAARWWEAARARARDAPAPIRALLTGRTRVEVSAGEALTALAWARALDEWDDDRLPPVWVYPEMPVPAPAAG